MTAGPTPNTRPVGRGDTVRTVSRPLRGLGTPVCVMTGVPSMWDRAEQAVPTHSTAADDARRWGTAPIRPSAAQCAHQPADAGVRHRGAGHPRPGHDHRVEDV